jgi:hypothetical protein
VAKNSPAQQPLHHPRLDSIQLTGGKTRNLPVCPKPNFGSGLVAGSRLNKLLAAAANRGGYGGAGDF